MRCRGEKLNAQLRLLRKTHRLAKDASRRGVGGTALRRYRRTLKKARDAEALARAEAAAAKRERAAALRAKAKRFARYAPEEARALCAEADRIERGFAAADAAAKRGEKPLPRPAAVRRRRYPAPPLRNPDAQAVDLAAMLKGAEVNFMEGVSYRVDPLAALKMVTASSVFSEPQYYRAGARKGAVLLDGLCREEDCIFAAYSLHLLDPYRGLRTSEVMERVIDEALRADYAGTLQWAATLREQYLMRLNPQVILVRAAAHPSRVAFTQAHPGAFARIAQRVLQRGDDVILQAEYYLAQNGSKQHLPAVLKRAWAQRIARMGAYEMAKYQNAGIGLIDVVRLCHAKGPLVDALMRTGHAEMPAGSDTWERLRAAGTPWAEILSEIRLPHMALLRNLRGIFTACEEEALRAAVLQQLKQGVRGGRQFPFRYLSAYRAAESLDAAGAAAVRAALEECMDTACENLPALPGRNAFLTDNSGSAWGACTSEYGTMPIAEIGNLSSVIGAVRSDEGVVFPFGSNLAALPVQKKNILNQARTVSRAGKMLGGSTENGIWLFFRDAIAEHQHWDNIFIYSDMQAGHGGLYGLNPADYAAVGADADGFYIDVNRLVQLYREQVNPRVNVFCIQTAGYTNTLLPEYGCRTALLYGWTGRELLFADILRRTWDEAEGKGA